MSCVSYINFGKHQTMRKSKKKAFILYVKTLYQKLKIINKTKKKNKNKKMLLQFEIVLEN